MSSFLESESKIGVIVPQEHTKDSTFPQVDKAMLELRLSLFGFETEVSQNGSQPEIIVDTEDKLLEEDLECFVGEVAYFFGNSGKIKFYVKGVRQHHITKKNMTGNLKFEAKNRVYRELM